MASHGDPEHIEVLDSLANLLTMTDVEQSCGRVPYVINKAVDRMAVAIAVAMLDEWSDKPVAVAVANETGE